MDVREGGQSGAEDEATERVGYEIEGRVAGKGGGAVSDGVHEGGCLGGEGGCARGVGEVDDGVA